LIRGETGTGKELVARAICQHSERAAQPFIIVNCAAIPENLLESELFGHEPGAFTDAKVRRIGRFEQANGGTLFLDEIGDTSLSTQVKLLRVLQEKTIQRLGGKETIAVDVRVITATHRNLELAIQEKEFREDLFYRLNVAAVYVPPLRERKEDIEDLINYFLRRHGRELGVSKPSISADAIKYLEQQDWPGNVRELENVIRKALLSSHGFTITLESVSAITTTKKFPSSTPEHTVSNYVTELLERAKKGELENIHSVFTETVERELYSQAIQLAGGDQSKAAKWLGVSRPTMREKLTRYSLFPQRIE
jgi:DNA-binding NtrC family response regulator